MAYKYCTLDIESTGLSRFDNTITYIGVGLANDLIPHKLKQLEFFVAEEEGYNEFIEFMKYLKANKVQLIWQNGKFDTLFIDWHMDTLLPIHHDVMLMGTAYDMAAPHGLKAMAQRYLGVADWDINKKLKTSTNTAVIDYLKKDVLYTWQLFCYFMKMMEPHQHKVYSKLLKPAYLMYRRCEKTGVYFDVKKCKKVYKEYQTMEAAKLRVLTDQYDINWNSPAQISDVLFNKVGMPTLKRSEKTGNPSADAKVLKRLAAQGFILPTQMLEYKEYNTANKMFLSQWGGYASHDHRIHPSFNLTNVMTGRTSCSDPNLQQVPRKKELRSLYTAAPGRVLIEADYSQIELRIAADYANDTTMLNIYRSGGDIHTETAASVSGKRVDDVTKDDRSKAKAVNFGFVYGMQAPGFVDYAFDSYGVVFALPEARRYRDLFFQKYSALLEWHKDMGIRCEMDGGVYNRFGRFRKLPDIYSSNKWEKAAAHRRAINTPVQSTASDLLISASTQIDKELRPAMDLWVVGTVHDSILADVPEEYAEEACEEIKRIMASPKSLETFGVSFKVPIIADVATGAWGSK